MREKYIWKPISFDPAWNNAVTDRFDNLFPSWERKRAELNKEPEQYERFLVQLKRKQAIDTGIIERMYDLKRGITETFIKEGFVDSYLGHGDTDIAPNLVMNYLKDNFDAIDGIFDFIKSNRDLSVSYIKELHSVITQHQDSTDAVNSLGAYTKIKMLKGQFKQHPNNPERDGTVYLYCPPEQVNSEMDNLINIYDTDLIGAHVLIKAAYIHHAFVQIHPFQDGNGRIARLLTSLILIKNGLFPFSLDRSERNKYIDALEYADNGEYQPLVDIIADNQIVSIEQALNWRTDSESVGYDSAVERFESKIHAYQALEAERKNINENMQSVFEIIKERMDYYRNDLSNKTKNLGSIKINYCAPQGEESNRFFKLIKDFADSHNYIINISLDKCWVSMEIKIDDFKIYRMIVSLHHYGFDDSAFAIGTILSKPMNDSIYIPLGLPPLTMSSEKDPVQLAPSIEKYIESSITTVLAYISNELV